MSGRSCSSGSGSGATADSTMPPTMTMRRNATIGAMLSPARAASTAAIAPSVARMGATTPTLPTRSA